MQQYRPEEAGGMAGSELASPGSRLVAVIIDTLIYVFGGIVGGIVGFFAIGGETGAGALAIVAFIAILIVQIVLLVTRGQTIGKIV